MDAVRVGGAAGRGVVALAVVGSALLMTGVLVGVTAAAGVPLRLPPGSPAAMNLAGVLAGAGLVCGLVLVFALAPGGGGRRGSSRRPVADSPDEWLDAMRPEGLLLGPAPGRARSGIEIPNA